eukprot:4296183-Lingulodinium_polyedra.AAC.1
MKGRAIAQLSPRCGDGRAPSQQVLGTRLSTATERGRPRAGWGSKCPGARREGALRGRRRC